MPQYDFSTLGSGDLELLARDLLNARERKKRTAIEFQSFPEGKDRGIDLLYSTPANENEIVVQVKHYRKSGVKVLIQECQKEAVKAKRLAPSRYILVTSIELSAENKKALKKIFAPFVLRLSDIIGNQDLNQWLDDFPDVQKNHYKLWFASSVILQRIINADLEGRNEYHANGIKDRIALFVRNESLCSAWKVLKRENVLVISGDPGCGKSTLAEMLLFKLMGRGFQLHYIYDDWRDIERSFGNEETKQVFYYDDFLGSISGDFDRVKSSENALSQLIKRFQRSRNKHLILTTRKFILNEVTSRSEKLRRLKLQHQELTLELASYSESQRLQMLANHCDLYDLGEGFRRILKQYQLGTHIIGHENFSPRFIDIFTNPQYLRGVAPTSYKSFILENLDNPEEIWKHAFLEQIGDEDRILLMVLFSLGKRFSPVQLEKAFDFRIRWETQNRGLRPRDGGFRRSMERLENGFLKIELRQGHPFIAFHSPSIEDFLYHLFSKNNDIIRNSFEGSYYLEQLVVRTDMRSNRIPFLHSKKLFERIANDSVNDSLCGAELRNENFLRFYLLITHFNDNPESTPIGIHFLSEIDFEDLSDRYLDLLMPILEGTTKKSALHDGIHSAFPGIFMFLVKHRLTEHDFPGGIEELIALCHQFECDGTEILEKVGAEEEVTERFDSLLEDYISDEIENLKDWVENDHDFYLDEIKETVEDCVQKLGYEFGIFLIPNFDAWEEDWGEICLANHVTRMVNKDD